MATTNFFQNSGLLKPVEQTAENPSNTRGFKEGQIIWNSTEETFYKVQSGSWVPVDLSGSGININSLGDVNTSGVSDGQGIAYVASTSTWEPATFGAGSGSSVLNDLSDVTITGPQDNDVLYYDSSTSQWRRQAFSTQETYSSASDLTSALDAHYVDKYYSVNEKTTSSSVSASDVGNLVSLNSSSLITVTVPPTSTAGWDSLVSSGEGFDIDLVRVGSGNVTVSPGSGVTVNSRNGLLGMNGRYSRVKLSYINSDSWLLTGDLTTPFSNDAAIAGTGWSSNSELSFAKTGSVLTGDIWVDPTGANGSGTEADPFNNLNSALSAVSDGERIIVKAGTLSVSSTISRNTTWATGIEVFNYSTDRPVIDASGMSSGSVLYFTAGQREHWKGFEIKNGPDRGVQVEASETTIEDFWVHNVEGDGIYVADFGGGASDNVIQDCRVWRLGDGTSTGTNTPDGIVCTGNTSSPTQSNSIVRCFVSNGPDDCFDLFRARGTRVINSVAHSAGRYWNGTTTSGDGTGFKMGGGDSDCGDNWATGCIAINNLGSGFSHNEAANSASTDPNIVFAFNTAVNNAGSGINTGGDQATHLNVRRDSLIIGNGSIGYVGANATNLRDITTNPDFADSSNGDYSLLSGSNAIGAGISGGIGNSVATQPTSGSSVNAGASIEALEIAFEWLNRDLTV